MYNAATASKKKIRDFFTPLKDSKGRKKLKCKTCGGEIADWNNTTNPHNHFKNNHFKVHKANFPEKYRERPTAVEESGESPPAKKFKKTQSTIPGIFDYQNSYERKYTQL